MDVSSIKLTPPGMSPGVKPPKGSGADVVQNFSDFLAGAIEGQTARQNEVKELSKQFAAGELPDPATLLIASEKSSIGLQLTIQVRNKAIEAYQEIMRTQM